MFCFFIIPDSFKTTEFVSNWDSTNLFKLKLTLQLHVFFLFLFLFFFYTPSSKIQHYISSSLYIKCLLCMCAHIQSCVVCIHVYLCASLDTCACCVPCLSTKFRSRTKPMHCPLPACILHLSLPSLLNNPYSFSLTYTLKIKKNKKYILINWLNETIPSFFLFLFFFLFINRLANFF